MIEVVHCMPKHIEPLALVLARAFAQDPLYEYALPDPRNRTSLASWEMRGLLRYGLRFGEATAPPSLVGCAVWLPPGQTDFTEARMAQVDMLGLAEHIGQEADKRLTQFNEATEVVHRRLLPTPHWYLLLLAIDPAYQRQGIGSALLAPMLRKANQTRLPIYLETTNQKNLPFYEQHGFEVRVQERLASDGPTVWYMVRKPPSPRRRSPSA
jgi:ribosomal protein S18 acetylase RimI-like enzyme